MGGSAGKAKKLWEGRGDKSEKKGSWEIHLLDGTNPPAFIREGWSIKVEEGNTGTGEEAIDTSTQW